MRPDTEVHEVFRLADQGLSRAEIAAAIGIGQTTVSRWLRRGLDGVLGSPMRLTRITTSTCPDLCPLREIIPGPAYVYLLGQFLGDGSLAHSGKGVYRLFLSCCATYPDILEEYRQAIRAVLPNNAVGQRSKPGCIELLGYSKHWPCLFPQHGPGRKHQRSIVLEPWQVQLALDSHPDKLIRGLIHSDGCRCINRIRKGGKEYEYVRYFFANRSTDIQALFLEACTRLGVEARPNNTYSISVARRESVARLDEIVGPKS
jgi:hypothetical protein